MRRVLAAALLLLVAAAPNVPAAPGLRLSWDHCAADGVVANKLFACDTNAGLDMLFGSFELPVEVPRVVGLEISLDIAATSDALPAWWDFLSVTGCRSTALGLLAVPPGPGACVDLLGEQAAGGIGYIVGPDGPSIARLIAAVAAPLPGFDATVSTEYFAFAFTLRHSKTVGAGACDGCGIPMCIGLVEIRVQSALGSGEYNVGLLGGLESAVTWQGAHWVQFDVVRRPARANSTIVCSAQQVPVRAETWGRLKALYR